MEDKEKKEKQEKIGIGKVFSSFKKSLVFAQNSKKYIIMFTVAIVFLSVIAAIIPMLAAQAIINLTGALWEQLLVVALIILVLEISRNICYFINHYAFTLFFYKVFQKMQVEVARQTLYIKSSKFDATSSGVFVDRISRDTSEIADFYRRFADFIIEFITNIGILIAVFIINKAMFIYFLIAIAIIYVIRVYQTKIQYSRWKLMRELHEKNSGLITETVRGQKDIKLLNSENDFLDITSQRITELNDKRIESQKIDRRINFLRMNVEDIIDFVFIALGIYLVTISAWEVLTIASFIILYNYRSRIFGLISFLASFQETSRQYVLASNRVFEIIDSDKFEKEKFGDVVLGDIKNSIEFKNVNFEYVENQPVLKNFNLTLKIGQSVGIVGKSGGGKTTVFSLLTKLYDLQNGEILLDGININNLTKESIRSNIAVIQQTPYLFNFTIRENLQYVNKDAKEQDIIDACKTAMIHDFIIGLKDGYDTLVGEGGVTLSGGQRQRLAIARALLKNSKIILLDEATSALDNQTQEDVKTAINNVAKSKTVLIIAHRLTTIKDCQRIILIGEGKVVADGTHSQLLKTNDEYGALYKNEAMLDD
ncbi:MAG: ABC transporter ATP-binding protein/permease [Firmicutes bacterium]|nr:ABC transporter ATP-binding protein/permease [Bacillota bacterium]